MKLEDWAQEMELRERAASIAEKQELALRSGPGYSHCKDCGEEIEKERRAIKGVKRCIFCQERYERETNRCFR